MQKTSSIEYGWATSKGPKSLNEDRGYIQIGLNHIGQSITIALVADGMGGYQAGDRASELVVNTVKLWWETYIEQLMGKDFTLQRISDELEKVIFQLNDKLLDIKRKENIKAGTTLSLLFLFNGQYIVKHVGDSRIYKFSKKMMHHSASNEETIPLLEGTQMSDKAPSLYHFDQLTTDHSWVQLQVDNNVLTKEQARLHKKRNVLLQCIGIEKQVQPFTVFGSYDQQTMFLLCSDGFYEMYSNDELRMMVIDLYEQHVPLQQISDYLVTQAANHSDASDNITVLTVKDVCEKQTRITLKEKINNWLSKKK